MNMNQFTQKSMEALRDMQSLALEKGNQQIEQIHLLDALVSKEDGLIPNLLKQSGASVEGIKQQVEQAVAALPKVGGMQADKLYLSRELDAAFASHKKPQPRLILQGIHHMRKARLGIAQLIRRSGKAALFQRQQQGPCFLSIHNVKYFTLLCLILSMRITYHRHHNVVLCILQGRWYTLLRILNKKFIFLFGI